MSVILALNRGTMLQFCWFFFSHLNYTHSLVFEVWSKEHFIRIGQKKNTLTMEFYLIESNCWLFLCIIHSVCLNLGQTSASTPNKQNKKKTYPRREREAVREIKCNYNGCSKHSMTQYYFFFLFLFSCCVYVKTFVFILVAESCRETQETYESRFCDDTFFIRYRSGHDCLSHNR